jgi:hypothetical protein
MNQSELFKTARGQLKKGDSEGALRLLADALRRGQLDNEGTERAGRLIRGELLAGRPLGIQVSNILLLGQFTTSWLVPALTAVAWGQSIPLLVTEGGYDTVLQDLMTQNPAEGASSKVVALLPWNRRLLEGSGSAEERIDEQLNFWRLAWTQIRSRAGAQILQVGYDWVIPGPLGHNLAGRADGPVGLVSAMNRALRQELPKGGHGSKTADFG